MKICENCRHLEGDCRCVPPRQPHLITIPLSAILAVLLFGCAGIHRVSGPSYSVETRADGSVIETWSYFDNGRGWEFMERGSLTNFSVMNSNLLGFGGLSVFGAGAVAIDISSNASGVISATGTAAGNVVGAAVKTSVGIP